MENELLSIFVEESLGLLEDLERLTEKMEESETYPAEMMRDFSLKIDRIMGAASTLEMELTNHQGLKTIKETCFQCKKLGQIASMVEKKEFVPLVSAFWMQTIDLLRELISSAHDLKKSEIIVAKGSENLKKRLNWLFDQLSKFITPEEIEINLKKMGLR